LELKEKEKWRGKVGIEREEKWRRSLDDITDTITCV
jgi:hypothetical protein